MKYNKKIVICFFSIFCFFLLYHFIIDSKNQYISFANGKDFLQDAIDNTINTSGYLWYNNTATIYTLLFVFILGITLVKLNIQYTTRISRQKICNKNLIISVICSVIYSVLFCLSHVIFMCVNFDIDTLIKINFFEIFILQLLSYILYYLLTSQIMFFIYYNTLNCVISGVITFAINALLMFAFRILKIITPIQYTLVCTKYYNSNMKDINIALDVLKISPIIVVFIILNKMVIKNRDVL